jgi:hypothetical protein
MLPDRTFFASLDQTRSLVFSCGNWLLLTVQVPACSLRPVFDIGLVGWRTGRLGLPDFHCLLQFYYRSLFVGHDSRRLGAR